MTEYIDKDGVAYALQAGFLEGEIVILSDDKAAWKVTRKSMADASPVFKDMFINATPGCHEVNLPDATRKVLQIFVNAISNTPQSPLYPAFTRAKPAIDLLLRYECTELAKQLLYNSCTDLGHEELFDAFALASYLDEIKCGCRILLQGYRWCDPNIPMALRTTPSLSPSSYPGCWTAAHAARVNPSWVWALSMGVVDVVAEETKRGSTAAVNFEKRFWGCITGEFMRYLTS